MLVCTKNGTYYFMNELKRLTARFYRTESGGEPVREWLRKLGRPDCTLIGEGIMTVEFGWPIGMPTCKPMGKGLFEIRTNLPSKRIARVLFCVKEGQMFLLHGFIKKTQKTEKADLDLALKRKNDLEGQ